MAQVKQLTAQDGGMAEQVAEAKAKRDEAARLVDQESAKRTEARLKAQQAEKSLKSATDRIASFTRQLDQLDRKITETQENRNEHQRRSQSRFGIGPAIHSGTCRFRRTR